MKFSTLYDSLLNNSDKLMKNGPLLKKMVKLIKSDSVLKEEYNLFENLLNISYDNDLSVMKSILHSTNSFNNKHITNEEINKSNKKLEEFLINNKITLSESIDDDPIYSLGDVITESNSIDEKLDVALTFLKENKVTDNPIVSENINELPSEQILPAMVYMFGKKCDETLNESQKNVFKSVISNNEEEKKETFNNLVKEAISLVNNKIEKFKTDTIIKEDLLNAKEKLLNTNYINESYIDDCEEVIELIQSFKEE